MTRPISELDVPRDVLEQQVADLVARQREQAAEQAAEQSADRLRAFLAPTHTTPEEGQK